MISTKETILLIMLILNFLIFNIVFAWRWCCSYHWWQNYCDNDNWRRVCNDWTYSPTCTCGYSISNKSSRNETKVCPPNSHSFWIDKCICNDWFKLNLYQNACEYNYDYYCDKKYKWTIYRESDKKCICPYDKYLDSSWSKSLWDCPINKRYCNYHFWQNSTFKDWYWCVCLIWYELSKDNKCELIPTDNNKTIEYKTESKDWTFLKYILFAICWFWFYHFVKK